MNTQKRIHKEKKNVKKENEKLKNENYGVEMLKKKEYASCEKNIKFNIKWR